MLSTSRDVTLNHDEKLVHKIVVIKNYPKIVPVIYVLCCERNFFFFFKKSLKLPSSFTSSEGGPWSGINSEWHSINRRSTERRWCSCGCKWWPRRTFPTDSIRLQETKKGKILNFQRNTRKIENVCRNVEHFNQVRGGDRNEGNSTDPLEKKFESVTSTPTGGGFLKQKGACWWWSFIVGCQWAACVPPK